MWTNCGPLIYIRLCNNNASRDFVLYLKSMEDLETRKKKLMNMSMKKRKEEFQEAGDSEWFHVQTISGRQWAGSCSVFWLEELPQLYSLPHQLDKCWFGLLKSIKLTKKNSEINIQKEEKQCSHSLFDSWCFVIYLTSKWWKFERKIFLKVYQM